MLLEMSNDNRSSERKFGLVKVANALWSAKMFITLEESDMEVAFSLFEMVQEILDNIHCVRHLEAMFEIKTRIREAI